MWKSILRFRPAGDHRHNLWASTAVVITLLVFHWSTDPDACGSDPVSSVRPSARFLLPQVTIASTTTVVQSVGEPVPSGTSETPSTEPAAPRMPGAEPLTGRWALESSLSLLELGRERLQKMSGYSVTFARQERIDGELLDPQTIKLKVRHEPFSLYMKWTEGDKGRQLIYVHGQNEGQVLIQPGGFVGRATGALPFAPDHPKILAESRYPATMAGFLAMTDTIAQHHRDDLKLTQGVLSEIRGDQSFEERPCYLTTLCYENETINPIYRKSMIYIDKELSIPVCVRNYTWIKGQKVVEDNEESLIESYSFTGMEAAVQLSDNDFTKSQYKMR